MIYSKNIRPQVIKKFHEKCVNYEEGKQKNIYSNKNTVNKHCKTQVPYTFDSIIGSSKKIENLIIYSKEIANSPSTVLIQGESGTGKELFAQAIHNYSDRKGKAFIAINCGAIPNNLIESELFGYEEGAFTGARKGGCAGKFEIANNGTLFLDEIGDMPLNVQVHLLRVLQEGYVVRIGGDKSIPINVRIIAATNKDLKQEVEKGTFRRDLYYRLSVIPINIPPVRERKEDIMQLIKYFLQIKSIQLNKDMPKLDNDVYNKLINYNWPGNVRELENYIENLVNLGGKSTIELESKYSNKKYEILNLCDEDRSLEEIEREIIQKYLVKYDMNITKTSQILKISRSTLYNKIKKLNIQVL